MTLRPLASLLLLGLLACGGEELLAPCDAPPTPDSSQPFVERAAELGIDAVHHLGTDFCDLSDTIGGPGVCLFDYDGDGDLDVYLVDHAPQPNLLYQNEGASFSEVGASLGVDVTTDSMGCSTFDYDADGDLDLYVTNAGADQLLRNDGGAFSDVSDSSGIAALTTGFNITATAGDVDGDGDIDLFVGGAVQLDTCPDKCMDSPAPCQPEPNVMLINEGSGKFTDQTQTRGLSFPAVTLTTLLFDFEPDGDLDLYVGNDIGLLYPDYLFVNDGTGNFVDDAVGLGVYGPGTDTMGIDVGDIDADGLSDMVITDFRERPVRLFHCLNADFACSNEVVPDGLDYVNWGVGFADFDNDTDLDLFVTSGEVEFIEGNRNLLYFNDDGLFTEYFGADDDPIAAAEMSRGAAFGDLDNDGDVDVVFTNVGGPPRVLINQGAAGHALSVELDTLAVGAQVTIAHEGGRLREHALVGGSFASTSDARVHFGLGASCRADVKVEYVGGEIQTVQDAAAGTLKISR